MAEYIEREAAKQAVVEAVGRGHSPFNAIVMLPAADVRPVVRGRWERTSKSLMACSACGNCVVDDRIGGLFFCPNCGADMREEHDD